MLKVYFKNTATGEEGSEEFNTVRWAWSYHVGVVIPYGHGHSMWEGLGKSGLVK